MPLRLRLRELAQIRIRYGCRRLYATQQTPQAQGDGLLEAGTLRAGAGEPGPDYGLRPGSVKYRSALRALTVADAKSALFEYSALGHSSFFGYKYYFGGDWTSRYRYTSSLRPTLRPYPIKVGEIICNKESRVVSLTIDIVVQMTMHVIFR